MPPDLRGPQCPDQTVLEVLAVTPGDDSAAAHTAQCEYCRLRLEQIRADNDLLRGFADVATAARPSVARESSAPRIEGYELSEIAHRGGQGVVYRAVQTATKRAAAVKMLLSGAFATDREQRRFDREIEIAAALRHPNIVTIFQSGVTDDGRRYVAMEYVPGVPLDRYVAEDLPPPGRARTEAVLRIVSKIAAGVGFAHASGVIHRDLKPSNILVDEHGTPRVLDFGLARPIDTATDVTHTHEFAGTPTYAAPEQFAGDPAAIGTPTDVYALGLILYNALTDRHPYPREGTFAELARHVELTEPAPPSSFVPRLPADIDTIVLMALAKDPQRRYSSATALAADVDDYLAGRPIAARRDSTSYVLWRLAVKHRVPVVAGLVVLLTVVVALFGLALLAGDLEQQRRAAVQALSDSTIHRARLMAAAGEVDRAERLLWQEAARAGMDARRDDLGMEPIAASRRTAWALLEYYARVPRLMRASLGQLPMQTGFAADGSSVWAVGQLGATACWSFDGKLMASSPDAWKGRSTRVAGLGAARDAPRAVVTDDGGLCLADTATKELIAGPIKPRGRWTNAAIAPDGSAILAIDNGRGALLLDGRTLAEVELLADETKKPVYVAWSGNGAYAAVNSAAPPQSILRWSSADLMHPPARGTVVALAGSERTHITCFAMSNDGQWVAASLGGGLGVWRTERPQETIQLQGHTAPIQATRFSSDSSLMLSQSNDGEVFMWRLPELARVGRWSNGQQPVDTLLRPELGLFVLTDIGGFVSVYELGARSWLDTVPISASGIMALAQNSDGTRFAWGGQDGELTIFDAIGRRVVQRFRAHSGLVSDACFSYEGREVYSVGVDGALRIWDADDGALRSVLAEGCPELWAVSASRDGRWLAASGLGGVVRLWDLRTGALRLLETDPMRRVPEVVFSPDGALLVAVSTDATATAWDTSTGNVRYGLCGHTSAVRAVTFSPDGAMITTGSDDRTIRFWDARTGQPLRTIDGIARDVFDLAFDPSGHVLYCVGRGATLLVYDALSGDELAAITVHERSVFRIAVSPDGRSLWTGGDDPWIGCWNLDHLRTYVRGNADAATSKADGVRRAPYRPGK